MRKRIIFLDMDGVMAAFDELVKGWLGRDIGWNLTPDITEGEWEWLSQNHPRLFRDLPICKGAIDFAWFLRTQYEAPKDDEFIALDQGKKRQFKIEFLTAIPRSTTFKYATQDKVSWGNTHFPGWDVCIGPFSRDKVKYSRVGEILIDDRLDNLKAWAGVGGQGIYHPTNQGFENTITALTEAAKSTLPGLWKDGKKQTIAQQGKEGEPGALNKH